MIEVLGLPLCEALRRMQAEGVCPEIVRTAGRREAAEGTERVIRISQDGRRLTVARFPDDLKQAVRSKDAQEKDNQKKDDQIQGEA